MHLRAARIGQNWNRVWSWNSPHDFKEGEFQPIRALGAYAEIGKDKEPGVFTAILMILEVVETGDDGAGGVPCLAVLEEVEFLVRVWGGEGGEHEVIRVLQERRGLLVCGVRGDLVAGVGVGDSELDDGRRVDGSSVRCNGCIRIMKEENEERTFTADTAHPGLLRLLLERGESSHTIATYALTLTTSSKFLPSEGMVSE